MGELSHPPAFLLHLFRTDTSELHLLGSMRMIESWLLVTVVKEMVKSNDSGRTRSWNTVTLLNKKFLVHHKDREQAIFLIYHKKFLMCHRGNVLCNFFYTADIKGVGPWAGILSYGTFFISHDLTFTNKYQMLLHTQRAETLLCL